VLTAIEDFHFRKHRTTVMTCSCALPVRCNSSLYCVYVQDLETNSKCSLLVARDTSDIGDTVVTIIGEAETVSPCRQRIRDDIIQRIFGIRDSIEKI